MIACWCFLPLIATLAMVACERSPALQPPQVAVSDSAGQRVVHIPPLKEFSVPELQARRLFTTQDLAGENLEFFQVLDGLFLTDGSLVLANSGAHELVQLNSEGSSSRRIGRRGQGPGEFEWVNKLLPTSDGGFLAWDHRFSRYSRDAEFLEIVRLPYENPVVSVVPLMVRDDGHVAVVLGAQRIFQASGERRDTVPLLSWDAEGSGPDTVGVWNGLERAFGSQGRGMAFLAPIGFARTAFHASGPDRIAIGATDSLDVLVHDTDMVPFLRIVAPDRNGDVGRAEQRAWERYRASLVPFDDEVIRSVWESVPSRETLPGFDGLHVGPDGSLWVGEAIVPGEATRRWIVFSPDGIPEGELRIPAEQFGHLPGRTELLAVGHDRIALLRRTRLDEEYVEVWGVGDGP